MKKASDKTFIFDLIVLIMTIGGIVLIFTSQKGNVVTPLAGVIVLLLGILYFAKLGTDFAPTVSRVIKSLFYKLNITKKFYLYLSRKISSIDLSLKLKDTSGKNNRIYLLILIFIVILGFSLRITNLTFLEPYTDEYSHLVAAKAININGSPSHFANGEIGTPYFRAFPLTYTIAFLFRVFGESLFVARLPGVILSTLTIILFYLMFSATNRRIGLIAASLWAISPWSIAVSRNIREYAIFPFFYILFFIFLIKLKKLIINLLEGKKIINYGQLAIYGIIFLIPIAYSFLDFASTFKQILLLYVIFILYMIFSILSSSKISIRVKKFIGYISLVGILATFTAASFVDLNHVSKTPSLNEYWLNLIFGNAKTQWYSSYGIIGFYIVFAIGLITAIYSLVKSKFHIIGFALLSFITYLYFFMFHFDRYVRPRYGFNILLWLIPLIAAGLYIAYKVFIPNSKKAKLIAIPIFLTIVLFIFSPANTYRAFNIEKHGYVPITNEHHDQYLPVLYKYGSQIKKDDVIVCSLCAPLYWHNQVDILTNNIYKYSRLDEDRFIKTASIIESNDSGWMILDWRRNNYWSKGYPKNDFVVGEKTVKFIENYSGFHIYRWQ